jgi:hypothetical protein
MSSSTKGRNFRLGPWLGSKEGEVANLKPHYRAMLEDTGFVVLRRRARTEE